MDTRKTPNDFTNDYNRLDRNHLFVFLSVLFSGFRWIRVSHTVALDVCLFFIFKVFVVSVDRVPTFRLKIKRIDKNENFYLHTLRYTYREQRITVRTGSFVHEQNRRVRLVPVVQEPRAFLVYSDGGVRGVLRFRSVVRSLRGRVGTPTYMRASVSRGGRDRRSVR